MTMQAQDERAWWINDSDPNEVYICSRWGYIEIGGFSSAKREAIAAAIMERLPEFQTDISGASK